jgi:transcriptional regulator with XRE-family HTH domain
MGKLKTWRRARRLSQEALGAQLGVSAVAIGRYEMGRVPEAAVLQKLIDLTGGAITANDFFELPNDEEAAR